MPPFVSFFRLCCVTLPRFLSNRLISLKILRNIKYIIACLLSALLMQSCFTGVEGTGKITLSKKEQSIIAPTKEDKFLSLVSTSVGNWPIGKKFLIADEKFNLIIDGGSVSPMAKGDTLYYSEAKATSALDGGERTILTFRTTDGRKILYPIDRSLEKTTTEVCSLDIPMLIDLDIVEAADNKLRNVTLWTKTAQWYDENLNYTKGKKFEEVKVKEVMPGNSFFPLLIVFSSKDGKEGRLLLNAGVTSNESRNFGKQFFLSDPRSNYRNISEENWEAIKSEQLRLGMTKEEARLSRGNPSDVDMGHNYSNAMEIWFYPNGSYLRFTDGLLVDFK